MPWTSSFDCSSRLLLAIEFPFFIYLLSAGRKKVTRVLYCCSLLWRNTRATNQSEVMNMKLLLMIVKTLLSPHAVLGPFISHTNRLLSRCCSNRLHDLPFFSLTFCFRELISGSPTLIPLAPRFLSSEEAESFKMGRGFPRGSGARDKEKRCGCVKRGEFKVKDLLYLPGGTQGWVTEYTATDICFLVHADIIKKPSGGLWIGSSKYNEYLI